MDLFVSEFPVQGSHDPVPWIPSYPCCAHDLAEGDDHGQATASVPPLGERCGFMEVHGCDQP